MRLHKSCIPPFYVLVTLVVACGGQPGGGTEAPAGTPATAADDGARLYATYCAACHQADGTGVPYLYPPLTGSDWVGGDEGRLIRLALDGLAGPLEVGGETYNNIMPPHGFLNDEEIAAVLTFVRSNFGNDAGPIAPKDVAAVRAADDREGHWEPAELWERTGIPEE